MSRDDSWLRSKRHGEKWPRFAAEVPPELAEELDARVGKVNGPDSRATMVRAGLRLYLAYVSPEPEPPVESDAVELTDDPKGIECPSP